MNYLSVVWLIFRKDLLAERRSREIISAMLVFALLSVIIFIFSFELAADLQKQAFAGTLWVSLCFASTLGLTRSFSLERENQALSGILLSPVDRSAVYFGKVLANWAFMLLLAFILVPLAAFFFNLNPFHWILLGILLLGTLGYALCGTFLSAITSRLHNRELFLPILLFPVIIPLLLAAIRATGAVLNGGVAGELGTWLLMLSGYDMLFTAVGLILFETVIADS
jgi:ABC-type transport system involved in cytochrome c biogenesis, permease component